MISLSKVDNVIRFTYSNSEHYPFGSGIIDVPVNSLSLVIDASEMATFKKAASNDIFICATYAEFGKTKSELETWFKENMVSTGGGGSTADTEALKAIIQRSPASIDIPDGTTSIAASAFTNYSDLTSVSIPDSVISIGENAFTNCSGLTGSIDIPDSVTTIGDSAFYNCGGLTTCTIGSGVTTIGQGAFTNCSGLTSINIPNGVTSIGNSAFSNCGSLTSIGIPDSVVSIDSYSFSYCSSLTSVTIGSGVTSIGYYVFTNCSGLTSITINATIPPTLASGVFTNTNNCPIYVPEDSVDTYKAASGWSTYSSRIQAITT